MKKIATASWGLILLAGSVATCQSATLVHRWSFEDGSGSVVADVVGGANGAVLGNGATWGAGTLQLPGGASDSAAYVDLPNNLVSGRSAVTFEGWVSTDGSQSWSRVFDFGSNSPGGANGELTGPGDANGGNTQGLDYFFLSAQRGGNVNEQRIEWRNLDDGPDVTNTWDSNEATVLGEVYHFAITVDSTPDTGSTINYWRDGSLLTDNASSDYKLSELNDVNNWLGRSNWTNDANLQGTFHEFRIYDGALSQDEVIASFRAGPNNPIPEPATPLLLLVTVLGVTLLRRR